MAQMVLTAASNEAEWTARAALATVSEVDSDSTTLILLSSLDLRLSSRLPWQRHCPSHGRHCCSSIDIPGCI